MHFCIPNTEIGAMMEIYYVSSMIPICKLCKVRVMISSRNYTDRLINAILRGLLFDFILIIFDDNF